MQFPIRNLQDNIRADDDYHQDDWSSDGDEPQSIPSFPDFVSAIEVAIVDLGGAVLPKLTWSCPKDAVWMATGNTLRCTTSDQVFLLLKCSDRVMHDISSALQDTETAAAKDTKDATSDQDNTKEMPPDAHVLALRKWYDLKQGREFRCFVVDTMLVGISQRDISRKYHEIEREEKEILARIQAFHAKHVQNTFPLPQYTYDCYVPSNSNARVKLIDFNPLGGTTSPLLFNSWEEVRGLASLEFRIIREDVALRPDTALYGVPYDFVDTSEWSALQTLLEHAGEAQSLWETMDEQRTRQQNDENINTTNTFE